jgi:hypothetical protein
MIIYIRPKYLTVVSGGILQRIGQLIAVIHRYPERIGSRQESHALGISQPTRKKAPGCAIRVVAVYRRPNRIAGGIFRTDIAARGNGDVKCIIAAESNVFELVRVSAL